MPRLCPERTCTHDCTGDRKYHYGWGAQAAGQGIEMRDMLCVVDATYKECAVNGFEDAQAKAGR
ncbi:MAG TPA: hypothetical protein VM537_12580 [Anaerolineae bacterium]|nr:hypothetical protein [Anaerolineae bacterium]